MPIDFAVAVIALAGVLTLVWLVKIGQEIRPKEPPPAYVSSIFKGRVEIDRDKGQIRSLLENSPFSDRLIVDPPGYLAVEFRDEGPHLENAELHELLSWLKGQGLPFSVDKGWGPAEVMEDLWVHGRIKGRFKAIYWTNPNEWHVSETYPGAT
ncbi:MAG TPA: hypothetical protein VGC99_12165 [Candidatus Tectomicrobia bacterium]